jgi:exodeoxyribonuclease V
VSVMNQPRPLRLTDDQHSALDAVDDWLGAGDRPDYQASEFRLGGLAGTGKTTVAAVLPEWLRVGRGDIAYCAYTGKAALVLNKKMPWADATTIHRLIYRPVPMHCDACPVAEYERRESIPQPGTPIDALNAASLEEPDCHWHGRGEECGCRVVFQRKEDLVDDYVLIVVDEASMVDEAVYRDLMSLEVPILWVGDYGQLPPVQGSFSLMENLDYTLKQVHRNAGPIVELAHHVRNTGAIPAGRYGPGVRKVSGRRTLAMEMLEPYVGQRGVAGAAPWTDLLVLAARNSTVESTNKWIRNLLGWSGPDPEVGDRVVCLRNNYDHGVVNGQSGTVLSVAGVPGRNSEGLLWLEVAMDGVTEPYVGKVSREQFSQARPLQGIRRAIDLFTYGYCTTVHKAQGSEARQVVLFEEWRGRWPQDQWARLLYTAVTRAREELLVVSF